MVNVASIAGYGWRQNLDGPVLGRRAGFPDRDALVAGLESRLCRATQWAGSRMSMDGFFCLFDSRPCDTEFERRDIAKSSFSVASNGLATHDTAAT